MLLSNSLDKIVHYALKTYVTTYFCWPLFQKLFSMENLISWTASQKGMTAQCWVVPMFFLSVWQPYISITSCGYFNDFGGYEKLL